MTRPLYDPYRAVLQRFNRFGIRYVVVGMTGINYYAASPAETFATLDYDLLLEPTLDNVERAIRALQALAFTLGTADGPVKLGDLRAIVRGQRTLIATTPDGLTVELLLRVSGYAFSELARDARTFSIRGVPVRVGRLEKLLHSKRVAGRPKDREFLRRYTATKPFAKGKKLRRR